MKKETLTIIIINYFALEELRECLASIEEPHLNIRIILFDNATDGKALEELKQITQYEIYLKYFEENIGFTAGCNEAFNNAVEELGLPEYVLFLNPDTLLKKNQLSELLKSLKIHGADLVYPRTVYPDGKPYCSGTHFDIRKMQVDNHFYKNAKDPVWADFYQGSVFLIKGEVYKDLGGMDEKLFMYFDEADFSFRLKGAGYTILYNPNITIIHNASYSMKKNHYRKAYYLARNGLYVFQKYNVKKSIKSSFWFFYYHIFRVVFIWYLKDRFFKSIYFALLGLHHANQSKFGKLKM